jgi:hypothetical protein
MLQTPFETTEQAYQEMRERVSTWTDSLGTSVDAGILETVVVLNLHGLHTFQSCEGHLDHGSPYPWITIVDRERSRLFDLAWLNVCNLEEEAKAAGTVQAYDSFLSATILLQAHVAEWETHDPVLEHMRELLTAFYTQQPEQSNPARLLVRRLQPGKYRLEPGFSLAAKELPDSLKAEYLARGQAEMQAFTAYLKGSAIKK